MPQIQLQTSSNLVENVDIIDILHALTRIVSGFEFVSSQATRSYHSIHSNFAMGEGAPSGFAIVTLKMLSGRSREQLKAIGEAVFAELQGRFERSISSGEAVVSLEICEMEPKLYWK